MLCCNINFFIVLVTDILIRQISSITAACQEKVGHLPKVVAKILVDYLLRDRDPCVYRLDGDQVDCICCCCCSLALRILMDIPPDIPIRSNRGVIFWGDIHVGESLVKVTSFFRKYRVQILSSNSFPSRGLYVCI
ncbi:hypothetical protein QCA50_008012 [Cerrena zonata]|uniref:Uncharacterized protein n=1 Tax=Cerrena zonata TaxID=2478898 RepID=A0AAW0GB05_9APHY